MHLVSTHSAPNPPHLHPPPPASPIPTTPYLPPCTSPHHPRTSRPPAPPTSSSPYLPVPLTSPPPYLPFLRVYAHPSTYTRFYLLHLPTSRPLPYLPTPRKHPRGGLCTMLMRQPCLRWYFKLVESYGFWRVFPWVVSLMGILLANFWTLLYAMRYFAFRPTAYSACLFTWSPVCFHILRS